MMHGYTALLMTLNTSANKTRFAKEVLNQIAAEQLKVPVYLNFVGEPIGSTTGFELKDDQLFCSFEIRYPDLEQLNVFAVPRGIVHTNELHQDEAGITVIDKMTLLDVSITSNPADTSLTKIS